MADNIFKTVNMKAGDAQKSYTWYRNQVRNLGSGVSGLQLIRNETLTNRIKPGEMYLFMYDPKHKDTLPYYDRFPLVFPFAKTPNGFRGLNMHYLAYPIRIKLLDRLQQFRNNDKMDGNTKLRMSWATLNGVARFNLAKPCVKEYLTAHVRSPFVKINSKDWSMAMLLPVERFVGATKIQVWQDSLGKI